MPHSERARLMEEDCVRHELTCDAEATEPVPKRSAASSSTHRLKGRIGSSKEKAAVFWSLVDSFASKIAEFISFVFKYFMTILMLLYSLCVGACAKDGTVSGVEHANCFK